MTMTNSFNRVRAEHRQDRFRAVTDALKNFPNVEVPEAAREFVKRLRALPGPPPTSTTVRKR